MLQKMGNLSARLAYEMTHRQKCQFSNTPQNFREKTLADPCVAKNGPIRKLTTARNYPNRGGDLALKRIPEMLQKMGQFSSRLESKMMSR